MNQKNIKRLETLPYPVVVLNEAGKILYRNRFARCLLPSLARLREALRSCKGLEEHFLQSLCLDGIDYVAVAISKDKEARLLCFFENFLPLSDGLSRTILGQMQNFFWELLNKDEENLSSESIIRMERIAARACSLRANAGDYLRFLDADKIFGGDGAKSCSLGGFFGYLNRALKARGLDVDFHFPDDTTVFSEGELLSFLILNLVYFVRLYCGERRVCLNVKEEGEKLCFSVTFDDDEKVTTAFETLLFCTKEDEMLLQILPLLCVLRACREKGIPWTSERKGGTFSFSFSLPKGEKIPVLFLSDPAAAEVLELLQMVKVIFS